jgi:hypothetical protein
MTLLMRKTTPDFVGLTIHGLVAAVVTYFLISALYSSAEDRWFWITVLSLIEIGNAALFVRSLLSR